MHFHLRKSACLALRGARCAFMGSMSVEGIEGIYIVSGMLQLADDALTVKHAHKKSRDFVLKCFCRRRSSG